MGRGYGRRSRRYRRPRKPRQPKQSKRQQLAQFKNMGLDEEDQQKPDYSEVTIPWYFSGDTHFSPFSGVLLGSLDKSCLF